MPATTRILVVDDDPKLTTLVQRTLTYAGFAVEVAADGEAALVAARSRRPDLLVLDVMLPGLDGLEVCRQLRAESDLAIVMLTARDAVADRIAGLETGADDYLVKPFSPDELVARVRAVLRRRQTLGRDILTYADLSLDTGARRASRSGRVIDLSTTEYKLLALLLSHPEQVLTRELLMERVWGGSFDGESNVLEVYVRYLRQKLEAGGESRLIQTVRGAGYVLRAESDSSVAASLATSDA
jgi:two-component system response regulator MprA